MASSRICSASSVRSVSARHTSSVCAPPSTWPRAIGTRSSRRSSSTSCLTLREPWVFTRSPMIIGDGSCRSVVAVMPLETDHGPRPDLAAGSRRPIAATMARMCSGVVPQQPPTILTPFSATKSRSVSAIGPGSMG